MPRLKQPKLLQNLAYDALVECTVQHCRALAIKDSLTIRLNCRALAIKDSLTQLYRSIADIKQYASHHMPRILFGKFCENFLPKFYNNNEHESWCNGAALEIIMDVQFVGLKCEGPMLRHLNLNDVHRILGLKVLDWSWLYACDLLSKNWRPRPYTCLDWAIEDYRLQDLTTFICPRICSDHCLEIIGPRCLMLEVLRIEGSNDVTDKGVYALRPCSELRIISLNNCSVSGDGINGLLRAHSKLEEFDIRKSYPFDFLSSPIPLLCPSMKRISLDCEPMTNADLHSVVTMFPNLTYLRLHCSVIGDLCILKDLHNLRKLIFASRFPGFSMENLKELLMSVGENISQLALLYRIYASQSDLNFIFEACRNIESLYIRFGPNRSGITLPETLIIPAFANLKYLQCNTDAGWSTKFHIRLEFCELSKLKVLTVHGFLAILEMTESMMLDDVKFPNLKQVKTQYYPDEITERIIRIAKNNNLDFSLKSVMSEVKSVWDGSY